MLDMALSSCSWTPCAHSHCWSYSTRPAPLSDMPSHSCATPYPSLVMPSACQAFALPSFYVFYAWICLEKISKRCNRYKIINMCIFMLRNSCTCLLLCINIVSYMYYHLHMFPVYPSYLDTSDIWYMHVYLYIKLWDMGGMNGGIAHILWDSRII